MHQLDLIFKPEPEFGTLPHSHLSRFRQAKVALAPVRSHALEHSQSEFWTDAALRVIFLFGTRMLQVGQGSKSKTVMMLRMELAIKAQWLHWDSYMMQRVDANRGSIPQASSSSGRSAVQEGPSLWCVGATGKKEPLGKSPLASFSWKVFHWDP